MDKVLIVVPHPDDEVLGCGGTIARHASHGDRIEQVIMTKVSRPYWSEEEIKEDTLKAGGVLGITKTHFWDMPAVRLDTVPQKELNDSLITLIEELKPDIVYIPHIGDINKDHRLIAEAVMVAVRPKPGCSIKKVLAYETLSETEWSAPVASNAFIPTAYVDITDTLETKLKAMNVYEKELREFPHPRSLEAISNLAALRGSHVGVKAAEAFMLIREIWLKK
jgi:LmbE family N-acetylglucosaminyl deacetylase